MTTTGQVRHAFPAYKVFIFGVDVTADVYGVEVRYQLKNKAPATCSISMANENDKYIFTTDDLNIIYDDPKIKNAIEKINVQESAILGEDGAAIVGTVVPIDQTSIDELILENTKRIQPQIKQDVISSKITKRQGNVEQPDITGKFGGKSAKQLTGWAYRYPLQAEDPIFHANDPIRVFFRDPFNPRKWYHMFCGFVSNFDDHVDVNNQRTLTIMGEGPLKLFRYARITTNPGIIDIKVVEQAEFDAVFRSFYASGFKGFTLSKFLFSIVFGNDPERKYGGNYVVERKSTNGETIKQSSLAGIGNFNFNKSAVIEYGTPTRNTNESLIISNTPHVSVNSLSKYQSIIDHEVKQTDMFDMLLDKTDSNDVDVVRSSFNSIPNYQDGTLDIEYVVNFIGTHPEFYPPDGGRLIMLMPASLNEPNNRETLLKDVIDNVSLNTKFRSRLGIACDTIERIDFMLYESPKGDIICEFPMYDFDPDDFGIDQEQGWGINANGNDISLASQGTSYNEVQITGLPEIKRGPFANKWKLYKKDIMNFTKGISDEKIRTQMSSSWYFAQNYTSVGNSNDILPPVVVTLRHLIPLYGVRLESVDSNGYIATKEAALLYAQIMLNKLNAEARHLSVNAAPNLSVWLNRPVFVAPRNCIGTITSITHTITWGMSGSMDTKIGVDYIRGWDGLLDSDNNVVYTPIGGTPSQPLNYKLLFGLLKTETGNAQKPDSGKVKET